MMTEELKVKVSLDTSELKNGIKQIKDTFKDTSAEIGGMSKATQGAANGTKSVTTAMTGMGAVSVAQTAIIAKSMNKVTKAMAPTKSYIQLLKDDFKGLGAALGKNFDAAGDSKIKAWFGTLKTGLKEVGETGKTVGKQIAQHLGGAFKTAALVAVKSIGAVVGAISAVLFAMTRLSESTREFRQAINQVSTSFITLGSNAETATATYQAFYRVLGDVQRSTEAANLLGQITTAEKDLVTWTRIATGAMAMFPDSLPTESLIEASNETIKTGKVVGTLADALNWPADGANKISKALAGSTQAQTIFNESIRKGLTVEEAFNTVLAQTNNETQREILLRASLNGIYAESAGLYEEINKELIAQNEAQMRLNQAMAKLGKIAQPVQTAFANFRAVLAEALAPAIKIVCDWLVTLIGWLTTAAAWVGAFLSVLFPGVADKINTAFSGVGSSIDSAVGGTGDLNTGLQESEKTAQKLRRTLMGFDELNVVSSMSSGSSGSGSAGTGTGGTGAGIDVSGLDTGDSVFKKAQEQMEDFKVRAQEIVNKIKAFLQEYKEEIAIIGAALAALGIAKLLGNLGEALELGDKFLGVVKNIKKVAATAITIVLQYSFVNEFMDNFIDGEGIKEYIKGLLVAAIGTGILYAMWGPAGLAIGLGVTAVASLDAVVENGGITNTESFTVALTGLAAAVGAVYTAWTKAGLGNLIKGLVDKIPGFSGAFAGITSTISKHLGGLPGVVTKAFSGLGGIITKALSAVGAAIAAIPGWAIALIAAIAATIALALIDYDFTELGYKLGHALGTAWKKIKDWFGVAVDWVKALGESIKEGIIAAFDWVKDKFDINTFWDLLYYIINPVALIAKLVEVMIEVGAEVLPGLWKGIKSGWNNLKNNIKEFIDGFVKGWKDALGIHSPSTVFADIGEDIIAGLLNGIKTAWTNIKNWFNQTVAPKLTVKYWQDKFESVRSGVNTKLGEARTAIINGWNNIRTYFNTNIAPKFTLEYWKTKFDTMRSAIQTKLGEVRTQVMNSWNAIKSYFTTNIAPKFTVDYWKNKYDTIRSAASTKLNEVRTTCMNAWNNVKSWFNNNVSSKFTASYWSTKFNSIKDGAKASFNGIIAIVEKAVNQIIKKINTLQWKIPDWVPGIGGETFGFNFKAISIPRLAKGGIAIGSTLANIGENGREAVLPLDHNTGWMDQLADRIATRQQAPTKIVLKVGEKELGWASINGINHITKQTGGLQLQLV